MSLKRSLGFFSLTNIVIGDIIGAGIFTVTGLFLATLYSPVIMLLLWLIGGVVALCGAISYSELGVAYPHAGGEYVFLSKLFNPVFGFLSGWVSFLVGFSAPVAIMALTFSEYGLRLFPVLAESEDVNIYIRAIAVIIILLFTLLHSFGLEKGSKVHNFLTVLKVVLISGFILTGFIFGNGSMSNFFPEYTDKFDIKHLKDLGLGLMVIMYSFSGWNAVTYIGSEICNPAKNIPRSLITGTFAVTILYVLLNALYVYALPSEIMKDVAPVAGLAANKLFSLSLDRLISLIISVIVLSSISACTIIGPRVYYAMAEKGHFFRIAKRINKHGVPAVSIIFQSSVSILFVLFTSLKEIILILSFSLGFFPILAVAGLFIVRRKNISSFKTPGYPFIQIFFIVISLTMLALSFMNSPREFTIALIIIVTGVPMHYLLKRLNIMKLMNTET